MMMLLRCMSIILFQLLCSEAWSEITHWTFTVCLGAKNHLQNVILQNVDLQKGFWILKMIF